MKKIIEKMNSKKEYAAPQMEIMDYQVQGFLCTSGGDVILVPGDEDDN